MAFTLGNWGFLVAGSIAILVVGLLIVFDAWEKKDKVIRLLVLVIVLVLFNVILGVFINWYNTSTASGVRAVKDWKSEIDNGINREITITAEDGREIFHYEGKVDIESNHTDNYIKFESEDGRRYIIYYGIQDTIQIIEK